MDRLKIAVLFGGCSDEYFISIKSAQEIARNINIEKYEPVYVGINREGQWKICQQPEVNWEKGRCIPAIISPDRSFHGLLALEDDRYKSIEIDVVFPVLHGKMGEDGAIQGLLQLSGIPYIGCDIQSSVLGMDKSLTNIMAKDSGVRVPEFWVVNLDEEFGSLELKYPVFVKPARSGSSFGVSKVYNGEQLSSAVENARQYDTKVLIEEAISGYEVGCAVMGSGKELVVGEVDQIEVSHGFFRIHQEKNPEKGSDNSTIKVPADISEKDRRCVQETAKRIYNTLGCKGLARVDMFLQEDGRVVLNEVNTMPGCTSYSRYPRMMAAAGLTMSELIDNIVELALKG